MLKLIGAGLTGLLAMTAAAYFLSRSKDQRISDLKTGKSLVNKAWNKVAGYGRDLMAAAKPSDKAESF